MENITCQSLNSYIYEKRYRKYFHLSVSFFPSSHVFVCVTAANHIISYDIMVPVDPYYYVQSCGLPLINYCFRWIFHGKSILLCYEVSEPTGSCSPAYVLHIIISIIHTIQFDKMNELPNLNITILICNCNWWSDVQKLPRHRERLTMTMNDQLCSYSKNSRRDCGMHNGGTFEGNMRPKSARKNTLVRAFKGNGSLALSSNRFRCGSVRCTLRFIIAMSKHSAAPNKCSNTRE